MFNIAQRLNLNLYKYLFWQWKQNAEGSKRCFHFKAAFDGVYFWDTVYK